MKQIINKKNEYIRTSGITETWIKENCRSGRLNLSGFDLSGANLS